MPADVRTVGGAWATRLISDGRERLESDDAPQLAALLDALEPPESDPKVRDAAAVRRERLAFARRAIRWEPSPERLARWLAVAVRRYGVRRAGAYLRRAAERGDSGTLLGRRGAGGHALDPDHEVALRGPRMREVDDIVAGGVAVLGAQLDERARLRRDLAHLLDVGDRPGARVVLLRLLGDRSPSDTLALARAIEGSGVPITLAREVLAA